MAIVCAVGERPGPIRRRCSVPSSACGWSRRPGRAERHLRAARRGRGRRCIVSTTAVRRQRCRLSEAPRLRPDGSAGRGAGARLRVRGRRRRRSLFDDAGAEVRAIVHGATACPWRLTSTARRRLRNAGRAPECRWSSARRAGRDGRPSRAGVGVVVAANFSSGAERVRGEVSETAEPFARGGGRPSLASHEAHHAVKKDAPSGMA